MKKEKGLPKNLQGLRRWSLVGVKRLMPFEKDLWEVQCDCGKVLEMTRVVFLRNRSCGCEDESLNKVINYGLPSKRLEKELTQEQKDVYLVWYGMNQRCKDRKGYLYKDYGARGIRVCERWKNFFHFFEDMGPRPSRNYSIERDNVEDGYHKGNCRWILKNLQSRNTRQTSRVIYKGKTLTLIEFLEQNRCLTRKDFSFVTTERKSNGKQPVEITLVVQTICRVRNLKEPD